MTLYTDTCGSIVHGLIIHVSFMVKSVCYTGLWIHWFHDLDATIPNGSVTTRRTSLVGVGHSRSNSIIPLMLRIVCYAMVGSLELYYRSLEHQPCCEGVISRVNHTVELLLLFTLYPYIITIHISRINKLS
jgi:hypothetical protein